MDRLFYLKKESDKTCNTLYDKIQLKYTYIEYILDHLELLDSLDLSELFLEVEEFGKKCANWTLLYEEAIYIQFGRLIADLRIQILIRLG